MNRDTFLNAIVPVWGKPQKLEELALVSTTAHGPPVRDTVFVARYAAHNIYWTPGMSALLDGTRPHDVPAGFNVVPGTTEPYPTAADAAMAAIESRR